MQYYEQCRQARDLPSIPGAVIISCDERLRFEPMAEDVPMGTLKVPEREGILRAIDGQHRLLALHAALDTFGADPFTVPAIIFDQLPEDHVVQMFVTINAKHTRLNPSHLVSLSGRQLYRDENLAAAHDIVRALNERDDSPLFKNIKLLGVGKGKVAQAPLAQELKKLFESDAFGAGRKGSEFLEESKRFYVNYFKQVALVFGAAWNGRKYSIRSAPALRAFVRVAPDVVRRLDQEHAERDRLPCHRPRDCAVGPAHRRPAVRDRRRLEGHRCVRSRGSPASCAWRCSIRREQPYSAGRACNFAPVCNFRVWFCAFCECPHPGRSLFAQQSRGPPKHMHGTHIALL